ncbi:hypothetical protein [Azotobacter chroococcum]|uniref:hypothetical protein n=1 Tax=Azotobacter chroococcum TaxID=353 RepID=UPI0013924210|nr:hypothetical protein [Azotobacter chroococcum]
MLKQNLFQLRPEFVTEHQSGHCKLAGLSDWEPEFCGFALLHQCLWLETSTGPRAFALSETGRTGVDLGILDGRGHDIAFLAKQDVYQDAYQRSGGDELYARGVVETIWNSGTDGKHVASNADLALVAESNRLMPQKPQNMNVSPQPKNHGGHDPDVPQVSSGDHRS